MKTKTFKIPFFDLEKTAFCGQAFRFKKLANGEILGLFDKNIFSAKQAQQQLTLKSFSKANLAAIPLYLGLSVPALEVKANILATTHTTFPEYSNLIKNIINQELGIRLLKQPILETCISYILSVNCNIPLISKRLESLAALFPENKTLFEENEYYFFPSLEQLKTLDYAALENLKLGFRTAWLWNFLQRTDSRTLTALTTEKQAIKKEYFLSFAGIGEKVFACIDLYAYNNYTAFPVDVWIRRSLKEYFDFEAKPNTAYEKYFGKYCGYFQQYLYAYSRNKKSTLK